MSDTSAQASLRRDALGAIGQVTNKDMDVMVTSAAAAVSQACALLALSHDADRIATALEAIAGALAAPR